MQDRLTQILASTRARLDELRAERGSLESRLKTAPPSKSGAFAAALRGDDVALIAEIKRRSPSAGDIAPTIDPVAYATQCTAGGARAVSVLTEREYFGGTLEDLRRVAAAVDAPALRKDFILDETQLIEARVTGAAAVLLIVRALGRAELATLNAAALALGLATLIEIHDERERDLAMGMSTRPTAIGVNARDLRTFEIDLDRAAGLVASLPNTVIAVAESGMQDRHDVERVSEHGADAVLVGTSLARSLDPRQAAAQLTGVPRHDR